MSLNLSNASKRKAIRYGIPFLVCIVGGSFGLKEFSQLRYTFSRKSAVSRQELEELGIPMKKAEETTIEAQYEKVKEIDIEHWENVRIPRPWEPETIPDKVKEIVAQKQNK